MSSFKRRSLYDVDAAEQNAPVRTLNDLTLEEKRALLAARNAAMATPQAVAPSVQTLAADRALMDRFKGRHFGSNTRNFITQMHKKVQAGYQLTCEQRRALRRMVESARAF